MTDFTTIHANNLEEIHMIAGDEQVFVYNVWDHNGVALNLTYGATWVTIFRYGDVNYTVAQLSGSQIRSGSSFNQFSVVFTGSGLPAGTYQQQVKILDSHGGWHVPSQGKIIIFPSPDTGSYVGSE
jgi:hypothetical protein